MDKKIVGVLEYVFQGSLGLGKFTIDVEYTEMNGYIFHGKDNVWRYVVDKELNIYSEECIGGYYKNALPSLQTNPLHVDIFKDTVKDVLTNQCKIKARFVVYGDELGHFKYVERN